MMREATPQNIRVGNGPDPSAAMGPLTTSRGVEKLEHHVADAVRHGVKILCGGKKPQNLTEYFFEPTIISDMTAEILSTRRRYLDLS
jgi:acyl-CoA reductase-like NAD-dependent aldehyde dehydrogenase